MLTVIMKNFIVLVFLFSKLLGDQYPLNLSEKLNISIVRLSFNPDGANLTNSCDYAFHFNSKTSIVNLVNSKLMESPIKNESLSLSDLDRAPILIFTNTNGEKRFFKVVKRKEYFLLIERMCKIDKDGKFILSSMTRKLDADNSFIIYKFDGNTIFNFLFSSELK